MKASCPHKSHLFLSAKPGLGPAAAGLFAREISNELTGPILSPALCDLNMCIQRTKGVEHLLDEHPSSLPPTLS